MRGLTLPAFRARSCNNRIALLNQSTVIHSFKAMLSGQEGHEECRHLCAGGRSTAADQASVPCRRFRRIPSPSTIILVVISPSAHGHRLTLRWLRLRARIALLAAGLIPLPTLHAFADTPLQVQPVMPPLVFTRALGPRSAACSSGLGGSGRRRPTACPPVGQVSSARALPPPAAPTRSTHTGGPRLLSLSRDRGECAPVGHRHLSYLSV